MDRRVICQVGTREYSDSDRNVSFMTGTVSLFWRASFLVGTRKESKAGKEAF